MADQQQTKLEEFKEMLKQLSTEELEVLAKLTDKLRDNKESEEEE